MLTEIVESIRNAWLSNAITNSIINGAAELLVAGLSLVVAIGSAIWSYFITRRLKKQEMELQRQLNDANSLNERLSHVVNSRFDYEFQACKDLSEASFLMCHHYCVYIQCALLGGEEDKKHEFDYMKNSEIACYEYRDMVFKYAAFIPEDLHAKFDELLSLGFAFIHLLGDNRKNGFYKEIDVINDEYQRVSNCHAELTKILRDHLQRVARGEKSV